MIEEKVKLMINQAIQLKEAIKIDIIDVKEAQHEKLLDRNNDKLQIMTDITKNHAQLNDLLSNALQNDEDIDIYRDVVNDLENHLRELYELNGKLATIVLPVKQLYKDIIDEITLNNNGNLLEVKA